MSTRRVVITGLGAVTPCGNDAPTTWRSMIEGRSGIGPVTRFDATGLSCRIAGEVKGFDGAALIGAREIRRLGLFMQYAIVAGDQAMRDAGFVRGERWPEGDTFGIYVGSGIGGLPEIAEQTIAMHESGIDDISAYFIPKALVNLATGQLAIRFGARGPSLVVSTACAVGNHSIGEAWRVVRSGEADVVIAGGTEASISPLGFGGFMAMRAMSRHNAEPEIASRPFDVDRDGFVMSEGAAVVVLEDMDHAVRRGARIYAELLGYGLTTDAHHVTAPSPGGEGAARAMKAALRAGGLVPTDVDYINAHGTSTAANDPSETAAIKTVFGDHAKKLMVSSTKGVTGHLLGAAGGVEAVATCFALHTGIVPPTATLRNPDPACDLDYIPGEARESRPRVALSNGFGFGGTNAVLAFRRWE